MWKESNHGRGENLGNPQPQVVETTLGPRTQSKALGYVLLRRPKAVKRALRHVSVFSKAIDGELESAGGDEPTRLKHPRVSYDDDHRAGERITLGGHKQSARWPEECLNTAVIWGASFLERWRHYGDVERKRDETWPQLQCETLQCTKIELGSIPAGELDSGQSVMRRFDVHDPTYETPHRLSQAVSGGNARHKKRCSMEERTKFDSGVVRSQQDKSKLLTIVQVKNELGSGDDGDPEYCLSTFLQYGSRPACLMPEELYLHEPEEKWTSAGGWRKIW
ncbi:hypothetical protein EI94DRAFT_1786914 [Lactarius quietus]|nr:hypothetical protein EI94DRAFT_1786914 [Lactarius quietus]